MGKKKSTSKVKLTNKSTNKRMKAGRKHKLQPSQNKKLVNIPNVVKLKQEEQKKKKNQTQQVSNHNHEELTHEDIEFSDDEINDFLHENSQNLSFLSTSFSNDSGGKKKKRNAEDSLAAFEKAPRVLSNMSESINSSTKIVNLLPIKNEKGIIKRSLEQKEDVVEEADASNEPNESESIDQEPLSLVELLAKQQNEVNTKKLEIAQWSQNIVENPDANISRLKQLMLLCGRDQVSSIRKLSMLSLLEVFKDIVPSYRIRDLSDQEKTVKVSRDVRKLRDFEESMLSCYQKYLQLLEDNIKDCLKLLKRRRLNGSSKFIETSLKPVKSLAILSTKCLSELLRSLSHFNFRNNIIAVIVPHMELHGDLLEGGQLCIETVKAMFKSDNIGEISLEIVKVIHKLVKFKPNVRTSVLETLLSLRINADMIRTAALKSNKIERLNAKREAIRKMSRKERKRKKVEDVLNKELQEVEAVESRDKIERIQTEIVKFVFVTYFRILKAGQNTPLLSVVLKGLSKFAHLISVEFFEDLMNCLKNLLLIADLGISEKLNCILTAFKILSGQGESLTIDPRQFYTELYQLLPRIGADLQNSDVQLVRECLNIMLIKRRKQVSLPQVQGFFKRISTLILHLDVDDMFDFILLIRNILQLHKKCDYLLDNEVFGCGVFDPDIPDPEHSNADSSALWEVLLLSKHYHPHMETYCKHLLAGAPSQGAGALSTKFLSRRNIETVDASTEDVSEYFLDSIPETPVHKPKLYDKDISILVRNTHEHTTVADKILQKYEIKYL